MVRPLVLFVALALPGLLPAGSSGSLLDLRPDGRLLLVANPDSGTVTVIHAIEHVKLREVRVGEQPEGVAWLGDGPLALATLYRAGQVVLFSAETGEIVARLPVAAEPTAVVLRRDSRRGYVSHDAPGLVSEIDLATRRVLRTFAVGGAARGLALSPDEKTLYVTLFRSAVLVGIDLEAGKITGKWQGPEEDNLCRSVAVHPSLPFAYLPHLRSRTTATDGDMPVTPVLTVADLRPSRRPARTAIALDAFNSGRSVCNPWEVALAPDGTRLYVVHAGTNDLNVARIAAEDGRLERVGHLVGVGQNPRAVRVAPDGKTVWVYAALDFEATCHDARTLRVRGRVRTTEPPRSAEWVRGKALFHTALPPLTRRRWVACASCHPDGQSDHRVWRMPAGPRRTPSLFGLAHTGALHWSADRDEVQDFEYTIRGPLMQGKGVLAGPLRPKDDLHPVELDETLAGRSADLDALALFCNSFSFPLSPYIPGPGKLSPEAERGRQLFFSDAVGCAKCHSGPYFTDSTLSRPFVLHDVGTGDDPAEKMGPRFDTPTLLGVHRGGPYLHHGKAATLRDVLTTCNSRDQHGRTSHLRDREIEELIAFLRALPYGPPGEKGAALESGVEEPLRRRPGGR
jgi:YVTN family beta-propeller protein